MSFSYTPTLYSAPSGFSNETIRHFLLYKYYTVITRVRTMRRPFSPFGKRLPSPIREPEERRTILTLGFVRISDRVRLEYHHSSLQVGNDNTKL